MAIDPAADQIDQVIEFAGLDPQNDRGLAIQALKVRAIFRDKAMMTGI
jgi:hypothetical protein